MFILCAKGLSPLLQDAECRRLLHGIRVTRGAPPVLHLFFADDRLLFFKASIEEARVVKKCPEVYERASS